MGHWDKQVKIVNQGLSIFWDGIGRDNSEKYAYLANYNAVMVTENLTCLNSGNTEILTCLRSEIKLQSSVAAQDSHPGHSVQCAVHLTIAWWKRRATEIVWGPAGAMQCT